jgi:hypothetical protein
LMFNHNPYEMLTPSADPEFDRLEQSCVVQKGPRPKRLAERSKAIGAKVRRKKKM